MNTMKHLPFALFVLICSLGLIAAVPTWEGMNGRNSIGSLIPGASYIEALGPGAVGSFANHLSPHTPGEFGNITISVDSKAPPMFFINKNQLWLLVNETAVYPVNMRNTTGTHELPLQLTVGKKKEGITNGIWNWKSTMLFYDTPAGRSNDGLFFNCLTANGLRNVFTSLVPVRPPDDCSIMTLHSFSELRLRAQKP